MKKTKKLISLITPLAIFGATAPVVLTSCSSNNINYSVTTCGLGGEPLKVTRGSDGFPEEITFKAKFYDKNKKEVGYSDKIIWNFTSPYPTIPNLNISISNKHDTSNGDMVVDATGVSDAYNNKTCTIGVYANPNNKQLNNYEMYVLRILIVSIKA